MIKELLLSIALSAASGISFVGSPKRSISSVNAIYGNYSFYLAQDEYEIVSPFETHTGSGVYSSGEYTADYQNYRDFPDFGIHAVWADNGTEAYCSLEIKWCFQDEQTRTQAGNALGNMTNISGNLEFDGGDYEEDNQDGYWLITTLSVAELEPNSTFDCAFEIPDPNPQYTLTKNFVNCDIASSPRLPDNFTNSSQLSYYVLMVSNAGGYGFTSESVTQTGGITIRNFNLFDQYNNSGYYASCSFNVDLPLNNCSLSVTASLPQYTITSTLEHCTVSPALPASYTGTSFSGDYTFTAVSGYGFNENYTHWEVSNLFVDSVEFSSLLWGSFYSSVTLHLRASGGNSSISVTAIKYDEESYKLGYEEGREDGWQAGYDRGHADGEIAGNSYGVWNWLKQAALTTGEFLSINLLPGFSIGGLLTALAGLVIIWFFIKGFLFKS